MLRCSLLLMRDSQLMKAHVQVFYSNNLGTYSFFLGLTVTCVKALVPDKLSL